MRSSRSPLVLSLGTILLVVGFTSPVPAAAGSDETTGEPVWLAASFSVAEPDASLEPADGTIDPGPGCYGSDRQTCSDLPVPQNGSCSCSSQGLGKPCRVCDSRETGQVVLTTCTVCPGCYTPPCHIQQCWQHSSYTCN